MLNIVNFQSFFMFLLSFCSYVYKFLENWGLSQQNICSTWETSSLFLALSRIGTTLKTKDPKPWFVWTLCLYKIMFLLIKKRCKNAISINFTILLLSNTDLKKKNFYNAIALNIQALIRITVTLILESGILLLNKNQTVLLTFKIF